MLNQSTSYDGKCESKSTCDMDKLALLTYLKHQKVICAKLSFKLRLFQTSTNVKSEHTTATDTLCARTQQEASDAAAARVGLETALSARVGRHCFS